MGLRNTAPEIKLNQELQRIEARKKTNAAIVAESEKNWFQKVWNEVTGEKQLYRFKVTMQLGPQLKMNFETEGHARSYDAALKQITKSIRNDIKNATITISPK